MPEEKVVISLDDLVVLRTLARHGINQTVQHQTVQQLMESATAVDKLEKVIDCIETHQLKTMEIEQTLTNITAEENPDGS